MKKVLFIVDPFDTDDHKRITALLETAGYPVIKTDIQHCLEKALYERPDCIIWDVIMEDNSMGMLMVLSKHPVTRHFPMILLTVSPGEMHIGRKSRLNVQACMAKPFQDDALLKIVKALTGHKKMNNTPRRAVRASVAI